MRRSDREITNPSEINEILSKCKVVRLAMIDKDRPYVVPLNFGYQYTDGRLVLYCHGALEGRKIDVLHANPTVFYEMDIDHELVSHEEACRHSYRFSSIMGDGTARFLDGEEKLKALAAIVLHQTGREIPIPPERADSVAVFSVEARSLSAKAKK